MSKPRPIATGMECSECALPWSLHPENPRRRDCIKLLRSHQVSPWTLGPCTTPLPAPWTPDTTPGVWYTTDTSASEFPPVPDWQSDIKHLTEGDSL